MPTQGRHIGHERIYVFKVNAETGELTEQSHIDARTYAEPRHLTISKDNRHVYVVNERVIRLRTTILMTPKVF